ncbi:MAG: hypothetical protein IAG13_29020 [Deltaproteobacteria bacterium]|nr:hypothetical protein [Nannocystaceae bacterium]
MPSAVAVHHNTLESFFFEELEHVQERTGRALPTEVEAYVVHLLATYATKTDGAGRTSQPLALDYLSAKSRSGTARATALRTVGDRALYISGVVPRSLQRTPVNVRYVRGIGESAYREVAGGGALRVLGLLAEMFADVATVIGDVVDGGRDETDQPVDLMACYERWRRSGDPRDAKQLVRAGVLLDPEGSDILQ